MFCFVSWFDLFFVLLCWGFFLFVGVFCLFVLLLMLLFWGLL